MLSKFVIFLKKPYPLNVNSFKELPIITGFSFFVSLFLILFQPFGLDRFQHPHKNLLLVGVGAICFVVQAVDNYLLPRILRRPFNEDKWNIGREIVWNGWLFMSIILVLAFYWAYVSGAALTANYLLLYTINSLLFVLLLLPSCIMLNYIRLIKKRLRATETLSHRLQSSEAFANGADIELRSDSGTDQVKLSTLNLLFIQSHDNYSNVVSRDNGKTEERLLRSSLRNLERQLSQRFIVRCHRSFIVNLAQVRSVTGNARHYTLLLRSHALPIPVSRESEKQILQLLEDLNQR